MTEDRKTQLAAFIEEVKALQAKLDEGLAKEAHDVYDVLVEIEPEMNEDGEIDDENFNEVDFATDKFAEVGSFLYEAIEALEEVLNY